MVIIWHKNFQFQHFFLFLPLTLSLSAYECIQTEKKLNKAISECICIWRREKNYIKQWNNHVLFIRFFMNKKLFLFLFIYLGFCVLFFVFSLSDATYNWECMHACIHNVHAMMHVFFLFFFILYKEVGIDYACSLTCLLSKTSPMQIERRVG